MSTTTFLGAVNATLARVSVLQGVQGYLTSFTDSGKQIDIDVCKQCWNDVLQDMAAESPMIPGLTDSGSITLVASTKEYAPPTGTQWGKAIELVRWITYPSGRITLTEYPGGYEEMVVAQPDPTAFQGPPYQWCMSAITANIRFDFTPTSNEAGRVYTVFGIPRVFLSTTTDTFPLSDTVVDQLVPVVAMKWRKERQKGDFDREEYYQGIGDALRWANRIPPRQRWGVRRG